MRRSRNSRRSAYDERSIRDSRNSGTTLLDYDIETLNENRFSHGYENPDYSRRNYWRDDLEREDHGMNENEPTGFFDSHPSQHGRRVNRAVGYGDENSRFAEDFNRRRRNYDKEYGMIEESNANRGYQRRLSNRPNPFYEDKLYYNPSNWDMNDERLNPIADNYNPYAENEYFDEYPVENEGRDDYEFDVYESYPTYRQTERDYDERRDTYTYTYGNSRSGQRGQNDDEYRRSGGNRPGVRRRPNVRDKRY